MKPGHGRIFSMIVSTALLFSLLAACGPKQDSSGNTAESRGAVQESSQTEAEAPAVVSDELEYIAAAKEPVTLKMFLNSTGQQIENWGNDPVSKFIMEKTGVKLELEKPTADDNQKVNLMIASGDLPDILWTDRNSAPAANLIKEGLVYSYDELIEKYAPNMKKMPIVDTNWKYFKRPDGKVYYFTAEFTDRSRLSDQIVILGRAGYYIRNDLYGEMGSPAMKTTDELEKVLLEVKAKYRDITHPLLLWSPLGCDADDSGVNTIYRSFGGGGRFFKEGEQVRSMVRDPLYLNALLYINRLYRQGLVNMSDFTDKTEQQQVNNNSGKIFISAGTFWRIIEGTNEITKVLPNAGYACIDPLLAPGVEKFFQPTMSLDGWAAFMVTKKCAKPDRAIKLIEFLLTDEAQTTVSCGVEGKDWEWGGPENKFMVPTGEAADWIKDWNTWTKNLGTYKYNWLARNYFDSAFAWGLGMSDPLKMDLYKHEAVADDYSAFDGIDPTGDSAEYALLQKFKTLWPNYIAKICLAKSEDEGRKAYEEFIKKADDLGLAKVEAVWTENYKKRQEIIGN